MNTTEKQKKNLLKIVDKLYKKDLEEICLKFYAPKSGNKQTLKGRVIHFIESDKQDIDFIKLRKEIKRVYKENTRIKKSPKKGKSAKKVKTSPKKQKELEDIRKLISHDSEDESNSDSDVFESPKRPNLLVPILKIPNPNRNKDDSQTANKNDNYDTISRNPNKQLFQTSAGTSTNQVDQWPHCGQPYSQPATPPPPQLSNYTNQNIPFPPKTAFSMENILSNPLTNIFCNTNNNVNQSQSNAFPFSGVRPPQPLNLSSNPVPNPQLIRPTVGSNNCSAQPINFTFNNFYQNSPLNYVQQNYYPNQQLENDPLTNPLSMDQLFEQQKFLLSQFPKSFQDNDKNSSDSDGPIKDYVFKPLPKYKVFKILKETKTIGSLSDIGTEVIFDINPTLLEPTYFQNSTTDNLKTLLEKKSLLIQLRFTFIADVNLKEQKDLLPEYLCIECNNKRIFNYEENDDIMSGPFNISDQCVYNQNRIKFGFNKEKYTFLMPCIYEISIVSFETCDTFLHKLKQNMFQFLASDSTKQLIRSRDEHLAQDDIISIDIKTKLRLICPLSCRRIETPCRTIDCKHIECFDAYSFFKTNESRYEWFCPICQKSAQFDKLRIDGYLTEILSSTEEYIKEIAIKPDGSYEVIKIESKPELVVIDLEDSVADSDDIECSVIDADGCIVLD